MRISVIGCGYVGLVTGTCLAELGHEVTCTDNDKARIDALQSGVVPIYEQYLNSILAENCKAKRLTFTSDAAEAVRAGDVIFICVGTPPKENGEADLSAIDNVARQIAADAESSKLVVEKSTVPVHTGQQLKRTLAVYRRKPGVEFRVASNPEFLREGTAVEDFLHPDRVVIGVEDEESERQLKEIYRPILDRRFRCPIHSSTCNNFRSSKIMVTSINSSELIKHASNSFLALKISYANMIADVCDKVGANIDEVTHAVGMDSRIGPQFLNAGLGFGGFCFPKDVQAFIRLAENVGADFSLMKEVELINKRRIDRLLEQVRKSLWVAKDKQVGVLGLAFKPNTDDVRFAPALEIIRRLLAEGAEVRAYDPKAMERTSAIFPQVHYYAGAYEVARDADALIIATEWDEFRRLDWRKLYELMARPLVIDGRNLLSPKTMLDLGFEYYSAGRPTEEPARIAPRVQVARRAAGRISQMQEMRQPVSAD